MNVIFVEPFFPKNQREFVRALHSVGARVVGIGEYPFDAFDDDLKGWLYHYEQVSSVVNEEAMARTVRWIQERLPIDRLEATVEAHIMAAARIREACGIPGTSARTAFLCRDKPAMKEVLRQAGVPTAASIGAKSPNDAWSFVHEHGYPIMVKPRDGAGAAGTYKCTNDQELQRAIGESGLQQGRSVAIEEFIEGHEGFYDTITIDGRVVHEFATHYYPNVLEAMRTRWISPQFITTNRIDTAEGYSEVKEMGRKVIEALGIGTSATHMEWFFGPKGLKFAEIGCRPPGVRCWDLYAHANEMDIYVEWAMAIVHGKSAQHASRRYAAGIVALRADRDGVIDRYDGLEEVQSRYGEFIIDYHLPSPGSPAGTVEGGYMSGAWIRMKHTDYDELRKMLDTIGQTVKVKAR
ncbi:MAG: ATPase [Candidatus Eisenbacteria bacterium]